MFTLEPADTRRLEVLSRYAELNPGKAVERISPSAQTVLDALS